MNEQRNEKRIDELISRAINTERPRFDAEKWKQKYPDEFHVLLSHAAKGNSILQPTILKVILKSPPVQIAAAVVIIIAVSFLSTHRAPDKQEQPNIAEVTKSPVEVMTAISLERAFWRGGIKAVEKQCKQAFQPPGLRSRNLSVEQILTELNNGEISGRTRL
jgi:hypothetical protein